MWGEGAARGDGSKVLRPATKQPKDQYQSAVRVQEAPIFYVPVRRKQPKASCGKSFFHTRHVDDFVWNLTLHFSAEAVHTLFHS